MITWTSDCWICLSECKLLQYEWTVIDEEDEWFPIEYINYLPSTSSYKRSSTVYLFKTWKRIAAENKGLTQLIMKI